MAKLDKRVKATIFRMISDSGKLEQDYVVELLEQLDEKPSYDKLRKSYFKAKANRIIASFKDENNIRDCFAVRENQKTTYINISTTEEIPLVKNVEKKLNNQVIGTNKSLKKTIRRRAVLEGQIAIKEVEKQQVVE